MARNSNAVAVAVVPVLLPLHRPLSAKQVARVDRKVAHLDNASVAAARLIRNSSGCKSELEIGSDSLSQQSEVQGRTCVTSDRRTGFLTRQKTCPSRLVAVTNARMSESLLHWRRSCSASALKTALKLLHWTSSLWLMGTDCATEVKRSTEGKEQRTVTHCECDHWPVLQPLTPASLSEREHPAEAPCSSVNASHCESGK